MQLSATQLSPIGQLVGLRLAGTTLTRLSYEKGNVCAVSMGRPDGTTVTLRLEGTGPIGTNRFRAPAIVSDIYVWSPDQTSRPGEVPSDEAWSVLFANQLRPEDHTEAARQLLACNEFAWLVLVNCLDGSAISALCTDVSVIDDGSASPSTTE